MNLDTHRVNEEIIGDLIKGAISNGASKIGNKISKKIELSKKLSEPPFTDYVKILRLLNDNRYEKAMRVAIKKGFDENTIFEYVKPLGMFTKRFEKVSFGFAGIVAATKDIDPRLPQTILDTILETFRWFQNSGVGTAACLSMKAMTGTVYKDPISCALTKNGKYTKLQNTPDICNAIQLFIEDMKNLGVNVSNLASSHFGLVKLILESGMVSVVRYMLHNNMIYLHPTMLKTLDISGEMEQLIRLKSAHDFIPSEADKDPSKNFSRILSALGYDIRSTVVIPITLESLDKVIEEMNRLMDEHRRDGEIFNGYTIFTKEYNDRVKPIVQRLMPHGTRTPTVFSPSYIIQNAISTVEDSINNLFRKINLPTVRITTTVPDDTIPAGASSVPSGIQSEKNRIITILKSRFVN